MLLTSVEEELLELAGGMLDESDLMDLVAVGITRIAWRDSRVEDWHRDPAHALGEGDMMRANAVTCRLVSQLLLSYLDLLESEVGANLVLALVCDTISDPQRTLPDGRTLSELAGSEAELASLRRHTEACAWRWATLVSLCGSRQIILGLAYLGAARCRRWWLMPWWPVRVHNFVARLHEAPSYGDPHLDGYVASLQRPPDIEDDETLTRLLLDGPDTLSCQAAKYCLAAGLNDLDLAPILVDHREYTELALLFEPSTSLVTHH